MGQYAISVEFAYYVRQNDEYTSLLSRIIIRDNIVVVSP